MPCDTHHTHTLSHTRAHQQGQVLNTWRMPSWLAADPRFFLPAAHTPVEHVQTPKPLTCCIKRRDIFLPPTHFQCTQTRGLCIQNDLQPATGPMLTGDLARGSCFRVFFFGFFFGPGGGIQNKNKDKNREVCLCLVCCLPHGWAWYRKRVFSSFLRQVCWLPVFFFLSLFFFLYFRHKCQDPQH